MSHRMLPLLTTTVRANHNPGDTFIGIGLQWLWEQVLGSSVNWWLINKFDQDEVIANKDLIQKAGLLIFGGTPQYNKYSDWKFWYDEGFWSEFINPNKIPVAVMAGGAGYPGDSISVGDFVEYCTKDELTIKILRSRTENALCFTTRDKYANALLNSMNIQNDLIACSATFATYHRDLHKPITDRPYIALIPPGPDTVPNKTPEDSRKFIFDNWSMMFNDLKKQGHNPKIVCNYIKEYDLFKNDFSKDDLFFTNDYYNLLRFYTQCNSVVSARLHGALPIYGIPGSKVMHISIDTRGSAVEVFPKIHNVKFSEFKAEEVPEILSKLQPSTAEDLQPHIDKYKSVIQNIATKLSL